MTLCRKNVPHKEFFNANKDDIKDGDGTGAFHAGIQELSSVAGDGRPKAARSLGADEPTPFNWVKADRQVKLIGADSKVVSADHKEINRQHAVRGVKGGTIARAEFRDVTPGEGQNH